MNKKLIFLIAFISFIIHAPYILFAKQWIIFYADNSTLTGHAFVSFVREDATIKQTVLVGCWGFYPKEGYGIWGDVEGIIKSDIKRQQDEGFMVEVTPTEFNNCLSKKTEWEYKKYSLTSNNCVHFIEDIAKQINKLTLPENGTWLPINYINTLKALNSGNLPCSSHPDVIDNYSSSKPNYHFYTVNYEICDAKQYPCCTKDFVFNIMASNASFTAPFGGSQAVIDCGIIKLSDFGSIITKIDKSFSITNYTKKGHIFYAGKVTRYVVKVGEKIFVYTVGIGNNKLQLLKYINDNQLTMDALWNHVVNEKLKEEVIKQIKNNNKCNKLALPSLFLFDLSGSMNEQGASGKPKIEEAKLAAKTTLQNISKSATQGVKQEIEIRGFSGGCVTDPTYPITNGFTTDVTIIENAINSIRYPDGGTPLAEAIEASKQKLQQHLNNTGAKQAKLIILSDGQATCTPIRPNGVFATGQVTITLSGNQQNSGTASPIKYYAVGFNIAPGSPAERDLQYLAQISGGKYLNAQNQFELTRAFKKFNRIYIPKPAPALTSLPNTATDIFNKGLVLIENETYPEALERYREFATQNPMDCNGAFNLALMSEANDLYKAAAKYYETYLTLCPNPSDKDEVIRQIENVKKDYETYIQYNRNVIMSDMAYLDYHFKKIQNGESIALATEFVGFIKEKWLYYKNLSDILEIDTRPFKSSAQEVFRGFQDCVETIKRNPQAWDRDATPVLSRTYINMERLLSTFK